jgi:hypothetical protein
MPTVRQLADSRGNGSCSTEGLGRLNQQIFELLRPVVADDLVSCAHTVHDELGRSAIPFLQPAALRALEAAVRERGGVEKPRLNHAYRTVAHQFVLFQWGRVRVCRIKLVNRPGTSTHENGIAIDLADPDRWITVLRRHGWIHRGAADPPHFTFTGRGIDSRVLTESVRAFQRLWNIHRPTDRISEDGVFGERETGPRLSMSPVEGF